MWFGCGLLATGMRFWRSRRFEWDIVAIWVCLGPFSLLFTIILY